MLKLKDITKIYETGGFKQTALNNINISFRKSEFAAILGQSGSGKTTLLNIVGGLDKYTSGDLIIDGVSTKQYKDRDWDTYRNHRVGFVFQSYNLIPHQTVLSNVELALTLSGISKRERRKRAKEALEQVGLKEHINKKPNQLSGGQMQRVAKARALINDPEIILADEPTGALDSETSVQIMEILKNVAKERLVIMVTHNPDLAEKYATRIIKVKDGNVLEDSDEYVSNTEPKKRQKVKKTSMGMFTALSLSLNNLLTKKGRTILTAFAGSIGIIGIALILALSSGVQDYINKTQRETLSSYPITIQKETIDMSTLFDATTKGKEEEEVKAEGDVIATDDITNALKLTSESTTIKNNVKDLKKYLDENGGNINDYVTDISYSYNTELQIYSKNKDEYIQVNPNSLSLTEEQEYAMPGNEQFIMNPGEVGNVFTEITKNKEFLNNQYTLVEGKMPENYNEVVLIVDNNGNIPVSTMYSLDIANRDEIDDLKEKLKTDKDAKMDLKHFKYEDIVGKKYKLILATDYYKKENSKWVNKFLDMDYVSAKADKGTDLTIVGIVKVSDDTENAQSGYIGYTPDLTSYVIDNINNSEIAKEQLKNEKIDVLTGKEFTKNTLEANKKLLGIVDVENPDSINIFPKDFASKEQIEKIIEEYNKDKKEEDKITYTDMVGVLISSVTSIVNIISYVLIAFVAISLIVSSIMIAIITYISVLERTKEIGILRAIGASKKDISRVFNAETIIEGFLSGLLGVGVAVLLCIPVNSAIESALKVSGIAKLPISAGVVLVVLSVALTVIAGVVPAKLASKKDPVEALRTE